MPGVVLIRFWSPREPRVYKNKCLEQLRHMFGRLQLLQDSFYSPVGVDEVGRPLGSHVFFPVHAFLGPILIGLDDFAIRVAQQWKGGPCFFMNFW